MASRWFLQKRRQAAVPDDPSDVLALGYLRVSTKKQERGFSPEAQKQEIAEYIRRNGWEPGEVFRDTLQGTRDDRPDYQRLLEQVRYLRKQGRAIVVVAAALDRTGRDLAELFGMRKELRRLGVRLHYTRDGGELDDDSAMLKGWQASKETEKLRERVTASKQIVADKGLPPSGPAALGYRWRLPQDESEEARYKTGKQLKRILDENERESPYARELFARAADGESVLSLVRWMAGLPDSARGDRQLGHQAIKRILRNPLYIARYDRSSEATTPEAIVAMPKGRWPALIDDDTWLAVQRQLEAHRAQPGPPATYLLAGLVRCPACGVKMHGDCVGGYRRYRCDSRTQGAGRADKRCTVTAPAVQLDAAVLNRVGTVLDCVVDPLLREELAEALAELHQPAGDEAAKLQEAEARIKKLRNRLVKAREDLYDEEIDEQEYAALTRRARAELAEAEADRQRLVDEGQHVQGTEALSLDELLAKAGNWRTILHRADVTAQRAVLAELISRVEPVAIKKGRNGKYAVTITWTETGEALREVAEAIQSAS